MLESTLKVEFITISTSSCILCYGVYKTSIRIQLLVITNFFYQSWCNIYKILLLNRLESVSCNGFYLANVLCFSVSLKYGALILCPSSNTFFEVFATVIL